MDVYVLRHAIAVTRGTPAYLERDSERPLTERGIKRMKCGVRGMKQLGLRFDLILSSPYRRARQTAQIVADAYRNTSQPELFEPLGAEVAAADTVSQLAARCGNSVSSVLLVGHEPQLSALGSILLSGDSRLALHLKKAGMFKLQLDRLAPNAGALEWWLTPRQLRQLGSTDARGS